MTLADKIYKDNIRAILAEPWEDDNRAVWEDGTKVQTKRIFGLVNRYDLSVEFPLLSIRQTPIKTCFDEIDWIYRKQSNDVNDLGSKIWDAWADEKGSIGKAYGYQVSQPVFGYDNQMDYILGEIKKNPTSRRLVIELWNTSDLKDMKLPPCAHHLQFVVKNDKLNLILKQRSQDFMTANAFNVVEYALLLKMVAFHSGLDAGELVHIIGDAHIYNKHEGIALEMLERLETIPPTLSMSVPAYVGFYGLKKEDFSIKYFKKPAPVIVPDVAI